MASLGKVLQQQLPGWLLAVLPTEPPVLWSCSNPLNSFVSITLTVSAIVRAGYPSPYGWNGTISSSSTGGAGGADSAIRRKQPHHMMKNHQLQP